MAAEPSDPAEAAEALGTAEPEAVAPTPVKVVVAGGFGVGKTTLVGSISEIEPVTTEGARTSVGLAPDAGAPEAKATTTVAMDFGRVTIDPTLVLYLFGTPGQERFGFMWDDLVDGALGAIVLADSRRLADAFPAVDYFEHLDLPFVVAVNRFDGELAHDLDAIRAALDLEPSVPVFATDVRRHDEVKEALLTLLDVVLRRALAATEAAP